MTQKPMPYWNPLSRRVFVASAAATGVAAFAPGVVRADKAPRIVVLGASAASLACLHRLQRALARAEFVLIAPEDTVTYRTGLATAAAGLRPAHALVHPVAPVLPAGVAWLREAVTAIEPARRRVRTARGQALDYDLLLIAEADEPDPGAVAGFRAGPGVVSVGPDAAAAAATAAVMAHAAAAGGRVLFAVPPGADRGPCPVLDLALLLENRMRRAGSRRAASLTVAASGPDLAPAAARGAVATLLVDRGIEFADDHRLVAVDPAARTATLRTDRGSDVRHDFDLLVTAPPRLAGAAVRASGLASAGGRGADIDPRTLRHRRYDGVFAVGEATKLPGGGEVAAERAQVPVVVAGMVAALAGRAPPAPYDGYTVRPIFTRGDRAILIETDRSGRAIDALADLAPPLAESWLAFQLADRALEGAWHALRTGRGLDGPLWHAAPAPTTSPGEVVVA